MTYLNMAMYIHIHMLDYYMYLKEMQANLFHISCGVFTVKRAYDCNMHCIIPVHCMDVI